MALIVWLTLAAFVTSIVSGTLGMVGGAMLLGAMVILGIDPVIAIPVHAVVQLVSNLTRVYVFLPHVRWKLFFILAACAAPGPVVGLWFLDSLDGDSIKFILGLLIIYTTWVPKWGLGSISDNVSFALAGFVSGTLGVVVGAVGPLVAPFLLDRGMDKKTTMATQAVSQAYLHVLKIVAFEFVGFSLIPNLPMILPMGVAVVLGNLCGKSLIERIPEKFFFWLFKITLSILAVRLCIPLWESWFH